MTDLDIAQKVEMQHINSIAAKLNIDADDLEQYGKYKAKLPLSLIDEDKVAKSNLILVTALTPTPAGEGKTTVSIGLNEGLNKIGKKSVVVLREPSLGPVFGIKGGAAGGGHSKLYRWKTSIFILRVILELLKKQIIYLVHLLIIIFRVKQEI